MKVLSGKTILLTGASKGFGKALAEFLWAEGASLILVARSERALVEFSEMLLTKKASHAQSLQWIACDVVDFPFEKIQDQPIDVLINNAAIQGPIGPFMDSDWQEWCDTIAIDLLAPVYLAKKILPSMRARQKGKIINLSGGGATGCRPNFSAYAVAKVGLVKFTETLAAEVAEDHIDINCVAPGAMPTQMLEAIVQAGAQLSGCKEFETAVKIGTQSEDESSVMQRALQLCAYLASDQSDGISGKLISAVWDPWQHLHEKLEELKDSDLYTLRRVVPDNH